MTTASASEDLGYFIRVPPNYTTNIVEEEFNNNNEFEEWAKTNPKQHANFITNHSYISISKTSDARLSSAGRPRTVQQSITYYCDHSRHVSSSSSSTSVSSSTNLAPPNKKRRTGVKKSLKCNCLAKYHVQYLTSGKIKVKYHWQHQRHDPTEISDAVRSQLPSELRDWIKKTC